MEVKPQDKVRIADRIWIAAALLQKGHPSRAAFSKSEILERLETEGLAAGVERGTLHAHLDQHLVANLPPSSGKYRMLFETTDGNLRLFRLYAKWSRKTPLPQAPNYEDDPLIRLIGSGKHIWADEHADEYVENLRREDI